MVIGDDAGEAGLAAAVGLHEYTCLLTPDNTSSCRSEREPGLRRLIRLSVCCRHWAQQRRMVSEPKTGAAATSDPDHLLVTEGHFSGR